MTNSVDEVKTLIYYNPRKTATIIETVSTKYKITKQQLTTKFIEETSVHPVVYASMIDEINDQINEDLKDFIKSQLGAAKDKFVAKHGVGASKSRATGNQEKRKRAEDLYNKWMQVSAQANMEPSEKNLKMFLNALEIDPSVIQKAVIAYKPYLRSTVNAQESIITEQVKWNLPANIDDLFHSNKDEYTVTNFNHVIPTSAALDIFLDYVLGIGPENIEDDDGERVILLHPDYDYQLQITPVPGVNKGDIKYVIKHLSGADAHIPANKKLRVNEAPNIPNNQLRNFFARVTELEQQHSLETLANRNQPQQVRQPSKPKPSVAKAPEPVQEPTQAATQPTTEPQIQPQAQSPQSTNGQITLQDVEKFISNLTPEERSNFVIKDILPTLTDAELEKLTKSVMFKEQ